MVVSGSAGRSSAGSLCHVVFCSVLLLLVSGRLCASIPLPHRESRQREYDDGGVDAFFTCFSFASSVTLATDSSGNSSACVLGAESFIPISGVVLGKQKRWGTANNKLCRRISRRPMMRSCLTSLTKQRIFIL